MATYLEELRANLAAAQAALEAEEQRQSEPLRKLATALHSAFCTHNHTDGCSWGYETGPDWNTWESQAHLRYLEKAKAVLPIALGLFGDTEKDSVDYTIRLLEAMIERQGLAKGWS